MSELNLQQEKVAYALAHLPNWQPRLNGYLTREYADKWGVVSFADFFYEYWEKVGRIIFENKVPNGMDINDFYGQEFIKLVDRKYLEWLKLMDYEDWQNLNL